MSALRCTYLLRMYGVGAVVYVPPEDVRGLALWCTYLLRMYGVGAVVYVPPEDVRCLRSRVLDAVQCRVLCELIEQLSP